MISRQHSPWHVHAVPCTDASLQQRVHRIWKLYDRAAELDPHNPAVYVDFAGFVEQVGSC